MYFLGGSKLYVHQDGEWQDAHFIFPRGIGSEPQIFNLECPITAKQIKIENHTTYLAIGTIEFL